MLCRTRYYTTKVGKTENTKQAKAKREGVPPSSERTPTTPCARKNGACSLQLYHDSTT